MTVRICCHSHICGADSYCRETHSSIDYRLKLHRSIEHPVASRTKGGIYGIACFCPAHLSPNRVPVSYVSVHVADKNDNCWSSHETFSVEVFRGIRRERFRCSAYIIDVIIAIERSKDVIIAVGLCSRTRQRLASIVTVLNLLWLH